MENMNQLQQENRPVAVRISGVKKLYRLGQIGGGTLQSDLQSWWAKVRGKEDPNKKIDDNRIVGETLMALRGIDLTIYQGERVGIIGRNGAGKSTLLKLLSRVTAPSEGEIDLYGRIASMLEVGTGFNGEMTGRENIYMNGSILGMKKAEIDSKMEDIIEFSEVRDFIDTPVKRYSSGMFVKLAFSVAAHLDAEIMIMDEVLAVGDMSFQRKCLDKMSEVSASECRTILYVSHNMNTIRRLCDRCVVVDEGRIVYDGEVEGGIALYLADSKDKEIIRDRYVFDDTYRTELMKWCQPDFRILELEMDNAGFECNDKIDLKVKVRTTKDWHNVFFRFEITLINSIKIGTMFSDKGLDFRSGEEKTITFCMDTVHMTPGKYRVEVVAYDTDRLGEDHFIDGVYPGFSFEISNKINEYNIKLWHQHFWGAVHFQDVQVVDVQ